MVNVIESSRGCSSMIYNINKELTDLVDKKNRINSVVEEIKIRTEEFEQSIGKLKEELIINRKELDLIKNSFIQIRLGDLIDEISWLSGVSKNKISTSLSFSKIFPSMEDAFRYVDQINDSDGIYLINNVKFSMKSNLSKEDIGCFPFSYFSFLSFNFNEIQCDDKLLKEHCLVSFEPFTNGEVSLNVSIGKDIDDVICNIPFYELEYENNTSWYPADLFTQAVINVSLRKYNSKVDKIRRRIK